MGLLGRVRRLLRADPAPGPLLTRQVAAPGGDAPPTPLPVAVPIHRGYPPTFTWRGRRPTVRR
jgi:hypothetical protein